MAQNATHLIWIDLEMTGLDPFSDHIIEIATSITDSELKVIEEGPVIAINQSDDVLAAMDEWNTRQHGASGLIDRVKASPHSEQDAEQSTLEFLKRHVPPHKSPMCGNSICQDRRFMARCMPELERYFHYRNLDVSTIKELATRWYPELAGQFRKNSSHLAMEDVRDSIRELQFYREHVFRERT
ncbi:MAG: oligoribonuclease [Gammaproteobacteria bacterium]